MLTGPHLNNSRSQRIVWLCEELGLDHQLVKHQRDAETMRAPDSLREVRVLGMADPIALAAALAAGRPLVLAGANRPACGRHPPLPGTRWDARPSAQNAVAC